MWPGQEPGPACGATGLGRAVRGAALRRRYRGGQTRVGDHRADVLHRDGRARDFDSGVAAVGCDGDTCGVQRQRGAGGAAAAAGRRATVVAVEGDTFAMPGRSRRQHSGLPWSAGSDRMSWHFRYSTDKPSLRRTKFPLVESATRFFVLTLEDHCLPS